MVLSNKKLKQKVRAELAQSLAASVAKIDFNNEATANPDQNPNPHSLKKLLNLATQRPRLSKRDKHRENRGGEDNKEIGSTGSEDEKKKKKKRKINGEEKDGNLDSEESKVLKEVKKSETKKKKKRKKKKQKKAAKNEEEKEAAELGSEEQRVAETNKNSDR